MGEAQEVVNRCSPPGGPAALNDEQLRCDRRETLCRIPEHEGQQSQSLALPAYKMAVSRPAAAPVASLGSSLAETAYERCRFQLGTDRQQGNRAAFHASNVASFR